MKDKDNQNVMFAASQGGHFKEMMGLQELFGKYDSILVTDNLSVFHQQELVNKFNAVELVYAMAESRKKNGGNGSWKSRWQGVFSYAKLFMECIGIYLKHRPKIVISTGSYIAVPLFLLTKLNRGKTIFIESNAMVYSKTLTGILVEKLSDKIYVQWPEMLSVYRKAEYKGVLH